MTEKKILEQTVKELEDKLSNTRTNTKGIKDSIDVEEEAISFYSTIIHKIISLTSGVQVDMRIEKNLVETWTCEEFSGKVDMWQSVVPDYLITVAGWEKHIETGRRLASSKVQTCTDLNKSKLIKKIEKLSLREKAVRKLKQELEIEYNRLITVGLVEDQDITNLNEQIKEIYAIITTDSSGSSSVHHS